MKLTCPAKQLLAAVRAVLPAAGARTTKPVLNGVHIEAVAPRGELANAVTLSTTDLEMGIRYAVGGDAVVKRGGVTVVSAAKLAAVLGEVPPDADVAIDAGEAEAVVSFPGGRWTLTVWPADEFPEVGGVRPGDAAAEIDAGELATLVARTAFAADRAETSRFATHGTLVEFAGGTVTFVGTDTKRLAVATAPVTGSPATAKAILPRAAVAVLGRLAESHAGPVAVVVRPNDAVFAAGPFTLYTRLIEGQPVPWKGVMPRKAARRADLPAAEFATGFRRAAVLSDKESKRVDCEFHADRLVLRAADAAAGASDIEVAMAFPVGDGEPEAIAFDPQFVLEFFRVVKDAPVELWTDGGEKPAVFVCGDSYKYLVMPLCG